MTTAESVPDSSSGGRFALLVGMSTFADEGLQSLRSALSDVRELGAVLEDPEIGSYQVIVLIDADIRSLLQEVETFFADRRVDDVVLFYVSTHGLLDSRRRLYFAASDTQRARLASTAMAAEFVQEMLDACRARTQTVLLDSSFSGAFGRSVK